MNGEGAPLSGTGMEVATVHVEVSRADSLGPKPIEQRHLRARSYAHYTNKQHFIHSSNATEFQLSYT